MVNNYWHIKEDSVAKFNQFFHHSLWYIFIRGKGLLILSNKDYTVLRMHKRNYFHTGKKKGNPLHKNRKTIYHRTPWLRLFKHIPWGKNKWMVKLWIWSTLVGSCLKIRQEWSHNLCPDTCKTVKLYTRVIISIKINTGTIGKSIGELK